MRRITAILWLLGCWSSVTHGGVVAFDPPVQFVDPSIDATVTFDVSISSFETITNVQRLDLIIGSDDISISSFEFAPSLCDNEFVACDAFLPGGEPVYPNEVVLFAYVQTILSAPLALGSLTLDVTGLDDGVHLVVVDPVRDLGQSGAWTSGQGSESLSGFARVAVVPEPCSLVLLGLGAVVSHRRRNRPV